MSGTRHAIISRWAALVFSATACEVPAANEGTSSGPDDLPARVAARGDPKFTDRFHLDGCTFRTVGRNPFFPLLPGQKLVLEGEIDGQPARLERTVLHETVTIDGIRTRVIEERHTEGGELVEVSRNFFALCEPTNSVFYFGEAVDNYENGEIVDHSGSWRHGVDGAQAGLIMPGLALLGARYFQEVAPGVALDRAEIVEVGGTADTPYRRFRHVLVTEESSPLEPGVVEGKSYAPRVGLIADGELQLVAVQGGDRNRDGDHEDR